MSEGETVNGDAVLKAFSQPGDMANLASESQKPVSRFGKNGNGKPPSTVKSDELELPEPDWSVERLGDFAQVAEKYLRFHNKQMAVHIHRLGHALTIAKTKIENGEWVGSKNWCDFLKRYRVPVTSDWRARGLYSRCPDEKKVAGLGITKAYRKFGLLTPPKRDEDKDAKESSDSGKTKPTTDPDPMKPKPTTDPDPTKPPPPKENSKTLTMFLAQVWQRLEFYRDEAAFIDQDKKESPEHLRDLINQVVALLHEIEGTLPNVA